MKKIQNIVVGLIGFIALVSFLYWLTNDPTKDLAISMPGEDNRDSGPLIAEVINIGENFDLFESDVNTEMQGTWPRFRGANFDNIVSEPQNLKDSWGEGEPEIMWSLSLGEGHAGPAIYKGRVYIMDYDEENREDALRCFSLETGEEIWRRSYEVHVKRNHGMSRTVPAVNEDYVVTIGPKCQVMCVDRLSGDFVWGLDMVAEYGLEIPQWYTAQCPLIDGDKVLLSPGGEAIMIAVDIHTGEILWEAANTMNWKMSHSSIIPQTMFGKNLYVYSADGGILAISAEGEDEGQVVWETNEWNHSVVAPTPVIMDDGKIFLTAGYGAGGMMLQVTPNGSQYNIQVLSEYAPNEGLACEQQTPVLWNDHLFGILPKDGGGNRLQLVCVSPDNAQEFVWTSGKDARFGLGPYIIADNKMYILNDDGTLTIVRPDVNNYIQLDQKQIFEGHDAWAPLAIADGLLLLRDAETMYCLDISE